MHCFRSFKPVRVGFTLVELLVVISIMALLMGLLLPVLGLARDTAKQCRDYSNLRQVMIGYSVYQNDFRDHVMWGYPPATVEGEPVQARRSDGALITGLSAQRYPWRLIPYLNDAWSLLQPDYDLVSDPAANEYSLSIAPNYGLNATYFGGSFAVNSDGFAGDIPNRGQHVVFKNGETRRPGELIVFAECQARLGENPTFGNALSSDGSFFVDAPRLGNAEVWRAEGNDIISQRPTTNTGLPVGRYSTAISTAFFDGHVASVDPMTLDDMRLWANWADDADYNHTN